MNNLINRKVYAEVPPKVEYSLTVVGSELIPFIEYLRQWGLEQLQKEGNEHTVLPHNNGSN